MAVKGMKGKEEVKTDSAETTKETVENPKESQEIQEIKKYALSVDQVIELIVVDNEEAMEEAGDISAGLKYKLKKMEELRLFLVAPIKKHAKNIEAEIKKTTAPLTQAKGKIEKKMSDYWQILQEEIQKKEAEQLEESRRLAEEQRRKEEQALLNEKPLPEPEQVEQPPAVVPVSKSAGSQRIDKVWTFEVVDEKNIPRLYLTKDDVKIKQSINDGVRDIPGLRIFQKPRFSL